MPMRRLQIALVSGLGVALVAAGGIMIHQYRQLREARRQRDTALQSLQEAREALRQSELRGASAPNKTPKPASNDQAAIARRDATIEQLTNELSASQANIARLQEQLSATQDENAKALASSSQHYQQLQAELQDRLDKLQKELDSAQTDLQSSRQRIAGLQKANDQLRAESSEGSTRAAEREHILASLQDLDRRRESYLTSIADRYRNITSQFRTMSGMLDSNRGQNSNTFSGPALDLIQNAISLSDNDLQHLSELNAKAFQLEKQLAKK
jgi:chromosome segregation ATPase